MTKLVAMPEGECLATDEQMEIVTTMLAEIEAAGYVLVERERYSEWVEQEDAELEREFPGWSAGMGK